MKKRLIVLGCILLVILALASETALLLYAKRSYVSEKRQAYANELEEAVVKLSASIRMGETERYDAALVDYDAALMNIYPYLRDDEKIKLEDYRAALDSPKTRELMSLNALLLQLKASVKEPQAVEGLETEPELAKLNGALLKLKECEIYCSVKDYQEIEATLTDEAAKLSRKIAEMEQENAARLGSEELIAWLDMLK